jgi:hypothetical protein
MWPARGCDVPISIGGRRLEALATKQSTAANELCKKTTTIQNAGASGDWSDELLIFDTFDFNDSSDYTITIRVLDEDIGPDDLIGVHTLRTPGRLNHTCNAFSGAEMSAQCCATHGCAFVNGRNCTTVMQAVASRHADKCKVPNNPNNLSLILFDSVATERRKGLFY